MAITSDASDHHTQRDTEEKKTAFYVFTTPHHTTPQLLIPFSPSIYHSLFIFSTTPLLPYMDQPGRCRRTDGKRWRCSKDVIPNEKYCQNHMHRGCQRSRKFMDNPLNASKAQPNLKLKLQPSSDLPCFPLDKKMKENGGENEKIEDSESNRGRDGTTKIVFKQASYASAKVDESADEKEKTGKILSNEKLSSSLEDNECSYGKVKVERVRTETSHINSINNVVGLDFSPKSVLRDEGNTVEPWRCRRTDGKRWRCRKEVIAKDQKYCAKHMHRGAKKRLVAFQDADCGNKLNPFALVKRANKLIMGFDSNLSA